MYSNRALQICIPYVVLYLHTLYSIYLFTSKHYMLMTTQTTRAITHTHCHTQSRTSEHLSHIKTLLHTPIQNYTYPRKAPPIHTAALCPHINTRNHTQPHTATQSNASFKADVQLPWLKGVVTYPEMGQFRVAFGVTPGLQGISFCPEQDTFT